MSNLNDLLDLNPTKNIFLGSMKDTGTTYNSFNLDYTSTTQPTNYNNYDNRKSNNLIIRNNVRYDSKEVTVPSNIHTEEKSQVEFQSSPINAYQQPQVNVSKKLSSGFHWSVDQYKHTKQYLLEKLGKVPKTLNPQLVERITCLKQNKRKYSELRKTYTSLARHFSREMELHNSLQMQMNELSLQNPELRPQFKTSAATYGCIAKNAEKLKFCIDTFLTDLETLLDKAITDAMESVKLYETCRLDYDIVKREFETEGRTCNSELQEKKRKLNQAEETLRVKVDLLNQNRITRLKKHLRVLNEATVAFYTGNELALNKAIESITSNVD